MDLWGNDDTPPKHRGHPTWLSPYFRVYMDAYGEVPSLTAIKRMGREFKELEEQYGHDETLKRFGYYCAATPLKFYSPTRFAETMPAWKEPERRHTERRDRLAVNPGESVDQYAARVLGA